MELVLFLLFSPLEKFPKKKEKILCFDVVCFKLIFIDKFLNMQIKNRNLYLFPLWICGVFIRYCILLVRNKLKKKNIFCEKINFLFFLLSKIKLAYKIININCGINDSITNYSSMCKKPPHTYC